MTHLSVDELIDVADDPARADRFPHLATCAPCAEAMASMRAALAEVRESDEVPEPSPLFWDHFRARVRAATDAEVVPVRSRWPMAAWRPALAAAVLVAVAAGAWQLAAPRPTAPVTRSASTDPVADVAEAVEPAAAQPAGTPAVVAPSEDADWLAASGLTGALAPESVAGLAAPTPAVFMAEELNQRELEEFARLLRAEIGGVQ